MTFVVGLTGGIGCGKSTVSRLFADLGITIVDTDILAKKFTEVNGLAVNAIREAFGDGCINSVGAVDRVKMLDLIFSDNNLNRSQLLASIMAEKNKRSNNCCSLFPPFRIKS